MHGLVNIKNIMENVFPIYKHSPRLTYFETKTHIVDFLIYEHIVVLDGQVLVLLLQYQMVLNHGTIIIPIEMRFY
jgi:hypothetical protein